MALFPMSLVAQIYAHIQETPLGGRLQGVRTTFFRDIATEIAQ